MRRVASRIQAVVCRGPSGPDGLSKGSSSELVVTIDGRSGTKTGIRFMKLSSLTVLLFALGASLQALASNHSFTTLPRSSPEAQGVSSLGVLEFIDAADPIDAMNSFMLIWNKLLPAFHSGRLRSDRLAQLYPNAFSGKKIRASLPRLLREIWVGFKAPIHVRKSEVPPLHEADRNCP